MPPPRVEASSDGWPVGHAFRHRDFTRWVEQGEIEGFPGQDLDLEIWQAAWPYGRRAWLEQASGHQKPVEGWPMPVGKSSVKHDRGEQGWAMKVRTSGKSGVGDGLLGLMREASG